MIEIIGYIGYGFIGLVVLCGMAFLLSGWLAFYIIRNASPPPWATFPVNLSYPPVAYA